MQARDQAQQERADEEARLFKVQVELAEAQKAAASIPDLEKELSKYRWVCYIAVQQLLVAPEPGRLSAAGQWRMTCTCKHPCVQCTCCAGLRRAEV